MSGLSATTFCTALILGICIGFGERNGLILTGVGISLFLFTYCVRKYTLRRIFHIDLKIGVNVGRNQPFIRAYESCKDEPVSAKRRLWMIVVFVAVLMIGSFRGWQEQMDFAAQCNWVNHEISGKTLIEARISDIRADGNGGAIVLLDRVYEIKDLQRMARWNGVIYCDEWPEDLSAGKRMLFQGKPELYSCSTNPGMIDLRENYRAKKIGWYSGRMKAVEEADRQVMGWRDHLYELVRGGIWRFRMYISGRIDAGGLSEPYRGLCKTLLLGERELLDLDTKDLFSEGGIAHILSVSGLHLGIIGMGLYRLLRRKPFFVPRGICAIVCTLIMGLYVEMTGSSVSGERALIQMCLFLLGEVLGRPAKSSNSLAIAAMYVLLEQPRRLFSTGFLYSFVSVAIIHICVPQVQQWMKPKDPGKVPYFEAPGRSKWEKWIGKRLRQLLDNLIFGACLALGNYPITIWFNYEYPLSSLAANLILVPLVVVCWYGFALYSLFASIPGCMTIAGYFAYPACMIIEGMMRLLSVDGMERLLLQTGRPLLWQLSLYLGVVFAIFSGIVLVNTVLDGKKEAIKICERYHQDLLAGMKGEFPAMVYIPYWLLLHCVNEQGAFVGQRGYLLPDLYDIPFSKKGLLEAYNNEFLQPYLKKDGQIRPQDVIRQDIKHALIRFVCWSVLAGSMLLVKRPREPGLSYCFLDVGQGDCCVITFPNGTIGLVDCGSSTVKDVGTRRLIPFLKYMGYGNKLDYVWLSHFDGDHMSGIQEFLMQGGDVDHFYVASDPFASEKMSEIMETVTMNAAKTQEQSVHFEQLSKNYVATIGGVRIKCVYPINRDGTGDNDDSMVLTCTYENSFVMFTGDISIDGGEADLTKDPVFCEAIAPSNEEFRVLKVAHHGSRYSSGETFLQAVSPNLAVVSVGATNRYGHPAKETLERLSKSGATILQTNQQGAVNIHVDPSGTINVKCCHHGLFITKRNGIKHINILEFKDGCRFWSMF